MFRYFSRLYEKHEKRILPVAIFAYDQIRDEPNHFEMGFSFLKVLQFQFHKVELRRLSWREYIRQDNPVAAALLSKMGFRPEERAQVRLAFLRMLTRMELDPARMSLLVVFFETYLQLTPQEEEGQKVQEYMTSWEKKGRAEGRIEGEVKAKQEAVVEFLAARFDFDPRKMEDQISGLQDLEVLSRLLRRLYTAQSPEEAQGLLRETTNPPVS